MTWKTLGPDRKVEIIVDPNFDGDPILIATTHPIWIVDTPKNRPLIDAGWNAGHARDLYYINKYEVIQPEDRAESLISVLDAVDDHHGIQAEEGGYDGIIVTGLSLTDAVKAKLEKLGFSITSVKADGFTLSGTLQEPVYLRQLRDI